MVFNRLSAKQRDRTVSILRRRVPVHLNATDDSRYFLFHCYLLDDIYLTKLEIFIN